ncbi:hypothetical protein KSX_40520 [Ktedonospora formicarum]|uniref:Uncharacterized protein n=2 Tax=Ktedonospora formicarum TaxID=2778364 RepID=A0A8J3I5R3_9CHLR|nr:hypothetical protein KSX_40520 [Ktedonospora formicarum]
MLLLVITLFVKLPLRKGASIGPITTAIVAALSAGAVEGIAEVGKSALGARSLRPLIAWKPNHHLMLGKHL